MTLAHSEKENSPPDAYGTVSTDDTRAIPEHESGEPDQNEQTVPGDGGPEAADEKTPDDGSLAAINEKRLQAFAARMKRAMSGEKQEGKTLAFLQCENDKLKAQIVQHSFGRNGGDQSGSDVYAYWLRQQMRLQRMKILHAKIRSHRTQIRHMLETHGVCPMDSVEVTCERGA